MSRIVLLYFEIPKNHHLPVGKLGKEQNSLAWWQNPPAASYQTLLSLQADLPFEMLFL